MTFADVIAGLPSEEYAFSGPLREALVTSMLDGSKTTTTSLLIQYELERSVLPVKGERGVVIDSEGSPVCVTEITQVNVGPIGEVTSDHARDEGKATSLSRHGALSMRRFGTVPNPAHPSSIANF
jgi:uncharacterized protein YhfF